MRELEIGSCHYCGFTVLVSRADGPRGPRVHTLRDHTLEPDPRYVRTYQAALVRVCVECGPKHREETERLSVVRDIQEALR